MKLADAWGIIRQFVEPELQVLGGQEGTAEVWNALSSVEAALKLPPRLPRPRGWVEPPRVSATAHVVLAVPRKKSPIKGGSTKKSVKAKTTSKAKVVKKKKK